MRSFALTHGGIITRIVHAVTNPFHDSLRSVEVTGIPAQLGNTVDAVGNVGPSQAVPPSAAPAQRKALLQGEAAYRGTLGVWYPKDAPDGHLFDTSPTSMAMLSALAGSDSKYTPASDGALVNVAAKDVLKAAGQYVADCMSRQGELTDALDHNPDIDIQEGWPSNGEPPNDQKTSSPAKKTPTAPLNAGTGIIPEQTLESPHADPGLEVGGTVEAPVVQP